MLSQSTKLFSRRGFMAASAATAAMLTSHAPAATPKERTLALTKRKRPRQIPFGLQLYSVRGDCGKDLPGTLAKVAKMGYAAVEFAGYYGRNAKDMRKLLDDNGLVCCGTHAQFNSLLGDNLPKTIEFNKTIGNKYLIVPGLPGQYTGSHETWLNTAKIFNELAEKVKPHGMLVGYHNHSAEFKPIDGKLPWDTFCSNTRKDVIMQLDTGNALHGGADPLPYLYIYPGRAITVHVKAFSKKKGNALIGEDEINWAAFFALCKAVGKTEWHIVEYESNAYTPLESVDRCLKNLRKMNLPI